MIPVCLLRSLRNLLGSLSVRLHDRYCPERLLYCARNSLADGPAGISSRCASWCAKILDAAEAERN
eukprot:2808856-Rhodomonas_salina.1